MLLLAAIYTHEVFSLVIPVTGTGGFALCLSGLVLVVVVDLVVPEESLWS